MKEQLERLRGGIAWGMTGFGPKPTLAPPDETGNDGGNEGDDGNGNDDGSNSSADAGGEDGSGDKGSDGKPSRLAKAGLFSKRSQGEGNQGSDGEDGADQRGEPSEDGRPKGLADKFWDAEKKSIRVDALIKAQTDAEKALGELKRQKGPGGGEVPETEDGYFPDGVTLPETVENLSVTPDDPGLKAWAKICKKEGIGKDLATRLMTSMFVEMDQFAPAPIDPEQEMKALGKGGEQLVDGLFVWVEGMERAGDLAEDDIEVIEQIMTTAKGARFLAKMRNMSGEKPIPVAPGSGQRGMSQDQWNEEYKAAVKAKDYKRQAELEALGEHINGTEPGISGRTGGYSI